METVVIYLKKKDEYSSGAQKYYIGNCFQYVKVITVKK